MYTDRYWDWARDEDLPVVLQQDKKKLNVIKIKESDEIEIPNPLHSFTFNGPIPDPPDGKPPVRSLRHTILIVRLIGRVYSTPRRLRVLRMTW